MVKGLAGVKVTVPEELLASVTVLEASVVFGFPLASCRSTVIVEEATPAVVVTAEEMITSLVAAAAVMANAGLVVAEVSPLAAAVKTLLTPARLMFSPLPTKSATPLTAVMLVVPPRVPVPVVRVRAILLVAEVTVLL